ncbi:MAG: NYN domain-containing protein [Paracoccaceae bacterium]
MVESRVAVLVDGDNISVSLATAIIEQARRLGRVDVARVYTAITQTSGWNAAPGYRVIHSGYGKNASDLLLSIDAMDLALSSGIQSFVIATSDGDFTHLAVRLRERGLTVTGMGESKAPQIFRAACSSFIVLNGIPSHAPPPSKPAPDDLDLKIRAIIAQNSVKGQGMRLDALAPKMHVLHGTQISTYPDRTWRAYLTRRPQLYDLDERGPGAMVRFRPNGFAQ